MPLEPARNIGNSDFSSFLLNLSQQRFLAKYPGRRWLGYWLINQALLLVYLPSRSETSMRTPEIHRGACIP
jgi:hypothetical protein